MHQKPPKAPWETQAYRKVARGDKEYDRTSFRFGLPWRGNWTPHTLLKFRPWCDFQLWVCFDPQSGVPTQALLRTQLFPGLLAAASSCSEERLRLPTE